MKWQVMLVAAGVLGLLAFGTAGHAKEPEYVGVGKCDNCHKKEEDGAQYKIWKDTGHAEAFEVLGTDEAKEAAQKVGVSGDPQETDACLVCHTTGFGEPEDRFGRRFDIEDGVQCEACHGPGSEYRRKKTMKKIWEERGPDGKGESPTAKKTGLVIPDENTCKRCHSKSVTVDGKTYKNPQYEPFDFEERWEKIKHPVPEGKR